MIVSVGNNTRKTKVVKKNLNPEFKEQFSFNIGNVKLESVRIKVKDQDTLTDDAMGHADVLLGKLFGPEMCSVDGVTESFKLIDAAKGAIVLNLRFLPSDPSRIPPAHERHGGSHLLTLGGLVAQ